MLGTVGAAGLVTLVSVLVTVFTTGLITGAATGRDVKVRPHKTGFKAEISFESPADAVAFAEELLRRDA